MSDDVFGGDTPSSLEPRVADLEARADQLNAAVGANATTADAAVVAEAEARAAGDQANADAIDAERDARISGDQANNDQLGAVIERLDGGDVRLQAALDQSAGDRVQTGLDRVATGADRTGTAADRVQTGLDLVATGGDRTATAADRVQTGLDRVATGNDRTLTAGDRVQTGLDRAATGGDRTATGADRVQTGLDRAASDTSATNAAAARDGAILAGVTAGFFPYTAPPTVPGGVSAGQGYWMQSADGTQLLRYSNVAGTATPVAGVGPIPLNVLALATQSAATSGALAGFAASSETIGIAPATDVAPGANVLNFLAAASTYDSTLDSFTASVRSVGGGTARLVAVLPAYAANAISIIADVQITGITSTGIKTFTAGVDYNLLDANGQPIVFPAGTRFALGSFTGALFDAQAVSATGFTIAGNASGYTATQTTGVNFVGKFQVTLGRVKSVRGAINNLANLPVAVPGESFLTEYEGPDDLIFGAVGNQSLTGFLSNAIPFYSDGQIIGVQYATVAAGDVIFMVFRGGSLVDWRRATLALGDRLTTTFTTPFAVKAGDTLSYISVSGYLKSQTWSQQPGAKPTNGNWGGATFGTQGSQFAMRAIVQVPRKPRRIAAASSRGQVTTIDQRFRGATLPGNTTFSATTVSGSRNLTLVSGTPVLGAPLTGAGIPASTTFNMAINGSTVVMSDLATASATITVTQTGWLASGSGTWTCNNGLISPSSASTDWARRYMHPSPINAQRRTVIASVLIGDLTNIGGICSAAQQPDLVQNLGSVIHIDAPANKGRVYLWGSNVGVAPPNAGLEVVLPWALAPTDVVTISAQIDRGKMTVWFTNARTGQSASIVSNFAMGSLAQPIHGGVMSGQLGAHFLQGTGGMVWNFIQNITHISSAGSRLLWYTDSTGHLVNDNSDFLPAHRIEDQRGKGNFMNFGKSAQTARAALRTLPQDFLALIGSTGVGTEVVWALGVNVDNDLGFTDAGRFAAFNQFSLIAFGIFEYFGCKVTIITPCPSGSLSTYVPMVINNELAGGLGDRQVLNIGQAVSAAGDGVAWTAGLSQDTLHPCPFTGAPFIANLLLALRPDWAGAI